MGVIEELTNEVEPTATATYVDDTGARQVVGYFGTPGRRVFGALHLPPERPTGGVVICPGLHSDFERMYRRDVVLGRALCAAGFAVHRFHYRGMGNSDGDGTEVTFETMRSDAAAAADRLRRIASVDRMGLAGTRWGGLVAAAVASEEEGTPLALFDPVLHGDRYFREGGRARAVSDARHGRQPRAWEALVEDMHSTGSVDVLGYAMTARLYDSGVGLRLLDLLGAVPRPVLVVTGGRSSVGGELTTALADRGFTADRRTIEAEEGWWFVADGWEAIETRRSTTELVAIATGWMRSCMP